MTNIAKKITPLLFVLVALLLPQLYAAAAHAAWDQTFVSSAGNDTNTSNNCALTTPCQYIDTALTVTNPGGIVVCLDTGLFKTTPITITQSVTIDCHDRPVADLASVTLCEADGIHINAPGGAVTLRNINISAATYDPANCGQNGISVEAASVVNIEDCSVENFVQSGIRITTAANTVINIKNTTIRNSANGISFAPTGASVNGSIDHAMITKMSGDGIMATGAAYFTVTNSVISNSAGVGVSAGAAAVLEVDSSSVSNNNVAFGTSNGYIRISRDNIYDNNKNYSISGGIIFTSGDNYVAVNGSTVPNGTITRQ